MTSEASELFLEIVENYDKLSYRIPEIKEFETRGDEMVNKIIRYAVEMFAKSDETHMQEIITLEDQVDEKERELQKKHVERLTKGECSPEAGMIFSDIVSGLERVADHATNIAFAITTEDEMDEGKTN